MAVNFQFYGAVSEVMAEMAQLVAAHGVSPIGETPGEPVEPPKTTTRGRKAKTTTEEPATGTAGAGPAEGDAAAASGAAQGTEPITRENISPRCIAYSQKAGPAALKEMFIQLGSEQGNFSGVADDKLPALSEALTAAGF